MIIKLTDEAKKKRAEYIKAWRTKNKDKIKGYTITYWNKKAQEKE